MKKLEYSLLSLLVVVLTFYSCSGARIKGKIVDAFGKPVQGVEVTVENTAFADKTNESGDYAVEYIPGNVKVQFRKDGYVDTALAVNIATESEFPAHKIVMYAIPNEKTIYYIASDKYIPLKLTDFMLQESPSGSSMMQQYIVTVIGDNFVTIPKDKTIHFLDHIKANYWVVKGELLPGYENVYSLMSRRAGPVGFKDDVTFKKEIIRWALPQSVTIRSFNDLESGVYAFIPYRKKKPYEALDGQVFLFKIE